MEDFEDRLMTIYKNSNLGHVVRIHVWLDGDNISYCLDDWTVNSRVFNSFKELETYLGCEYKRG